MNIIKKNWKYLILLMMICCYILYTFPKNIDQLGATGYTFLEVTSMEGTSFARMNMPKKVLTIEENLEQIQEIVKIMDNYNYRKSLFIGSDVLGYDTARKSLMLRFGNEEEYQLIFEIFSDGYIKCNGRNYGSGVIDKSKEKELYTKLSEYIELL